MRFLYPVLGDLGAILGRRPAHLAPHQYPIGPQLEGLTLGHAHTEDQPPSALRDCCGLLAVERGGRRSWWAANETGSFLPTPQAHQVLTPVRRDAPPNQQNANRLTC